MVDEPVRANYIKPFNLFPYNRFKFEPLKLKKVADFREKPKKPIRYNQATKLRDKAIKEYAKRDPQGLVDYRTLSNETSKTIHEQPPIVPKDTKSSAFRYKWVREVPVVSCRFTEHVMMYHKPPFTYYAKAAEHCGRYRLRNMKIQEPKIVEHDTTEKMMPGILV